MENSRLLIGHAKTNIAVKRLFFFFCIIDIIKLEKLTAEIQLQARGKSTFFLAIAKSNFYLFHQNFHMVGAASAVCFQDQAKPQGNCRNMHF